MYAVFDVKPPDASRIDEVLKDDLVSRQSIAVREASALGFAALGTLVVVEGSEAAVARATELFRDAAVRLQGDRAKAVYDAIKAQEEDAASGMGTIFG